MAHLEPTAPGMPAYTCTSDLYCATPDTFDTVDEFVAMCRACFGEAPNLRPRNGGAEYVDSSGAVVLRRTTDS